MAKADIDEPRLLQIDPQHEVIEFGTDRPVDAVDRPRREPRHPIVESLQEGGEQAVELVTETAPATGDDLVEKRLLVQREPEPGSDVEVQRRTRSSRAGFSNGTVSGWESWSAASEASVGAGAPAIPVRSR